MRKECLAIAPGSHRRERHALSYPPFFHPEDWLRFVEWDAFSKAWKRLKLNDDTLRAIQLSIMVGPTEHPVVPGTGGLRKMRFKAKRTMKGREADLRVCYSFFQEASVILLLVVYQKNQRLDLNEKEKQSIKQLIEEVRTLFDGE